MSFVQTYSQMLKQLNHVFSLICLGEPLKDLLFNKAILLVYRLFPKYNSVDLQLKIKLNPILFTAELRLGDIPVDMINWYSF